MRSINDLVRTHRVRLALVWWSEATQIRTIALWGIFGGNFIESDGFWYRL